MSSILESLTGGMQTPKVHILDRFQIASEKIATNLTGVVTPQYLLQGLQWIRGPVTFVKYDYLTDMEEANEKVYNAVVASMYTDSLF